LGRQSFSGGNGGRILKFRYETTADNSDFASLALVGGFVYFMKFKVLLSGRKLRLRDGKFFL